MQKRPQAQPVETSGFVYRVRDGHDQNSAGGASNGRKTENANSLWGSLSDGITARRVRSLGHLMALSRVP